MAGHRLVGLLGVFNQAELHGIVAINRRGFALRDDAGSGLDQRHGDHLAVGREDLRHADLFAENSGTHGRLPLPKALISTSTPAGRSRRIRASTVSCVGSGIGPATAAPVRLAVSTISPVD